MLWCKLFPSGAPASSEEDIQPEAKRIHNEAAIAGFVGLLLTAYLLEAVSPLKRVDGFFALAALIAFYGFWIHLRGQLSKKLSAADVFAQLGSLGGVSRLGVEVPVIVGTIAFLTFSPVYAARIADGIALTLSRFFGA